jgi:hypothetical protein
MCAKERAIFKNGDESSKKIYDLGTRSKKEDVQYFGSGKFELLKICQVRHKT